MIKHAEEELKRRQYIMSMCMKPAVKMCQEAIKTAEELGDISLFERAEIFRILEDAKKKIQEVLV